MSGMTPFMFEGCAVRSIADAGGQVWFVGKDVCAALGHTNHNKSLGRLSDDERRGVTVSDPLGKNPQTMTVVNEPGVYRLIVTSRLPAAERFKRWLFHEVLPAIRETGGYGREEWDRAATSYDLRSYAMLVAQARAIYGAIGADKLWKALPLPPIDIESVTAELERGQGWRIGEFGSIAVEVDEAMDGAACLRHLLHSRIGRGEASVRDVIRLAEERVGCREALAETGLFLRPADYRDCIAVAERHPRLDRLFACTAWAPDWRLPLLTLEGAYPAPNALPFGGRKRRAVILPLRTVEAVAGVS